MNLQQAASDVLVAAGFDTLAADVGSGKTSPQAAIAYALRWPGRFRNELTRAQKLVGLPTIDVRYLVETGERRYY